MAFAQDAERPREAPEQRRRQGSSMGTLGSESSSRSQCGAIGSQARLVLADIGTVRYVSCRVCSCFPPPMAAQRAVTSMMKINCEQSNAEQRGALAHGDRQALGGLPPRRPGVAAHVVMADVRMEPLSALACARAPCLRESLIRPTADP